MLIHVLIPTIWMMARLCATQKDECEYKGDMGLISVENCIAEMEKNYNIDRCSGIIYGTIYRQREDTPFWIEIDPISREEYPANLTYMILNMPDWGTEHWERIPGCESMRLNDTENKCILRPTKERELNYIYLPLLNNPYYTYCNYRIDEQKNGIIEFCDGDYDEPCYELKDGRYIRRNPFEPVDSSMNFPIPMQFCFFSTPESYFNATRNWDDIHQKSDIISEGSGDNISALLGNETVRCTIVETQNSEDEHPANLAKKFVNGTSDFVCFFLRGPTQNTAWTTNACCLKVQSGMEEDKDKPDKKNFEENNEVGAITAVATSLSVACVVIIVAVVLLYKRHRFTLKENREKALRALAVTPDNFLDSNDNVGWSIQEKENPHKITMEPEELGYRNEGFNTLQKKSLQANEEPAEQLRTASTTSPGRHKIVSSESDILHRERRSMEECELDGGMGTSTATDNVAIHDTPDECTDVDQTLENCFEQVTENNEESLDKYPQTVRVDEKNMNTTEHQGESGYLSKLPQYIKKSINHSGVTDVMIFDSYLRK